MDDDGRVMGSCEVKLFGYAYNSKEDLNGGVAVNLATVYTVVDEAHVRYK